MSLAAVCASYAHYRSLHDALHHPREWTITLSYHDVEMVRHHHVREKRVAEGEHGVLDVAGNAFTHLGVEVLSAALSSGGDVITGQG